MTGPEPALADGMRLPQLRAVWYSFFAAIAMMGITTWALVGVGDGADAVMLLVIGFAVAVAAGDVVPYVIGTGVSIPALLYAGPTDSDIRACDQALIGAGRPMRLSAALGA